MADEIITPEAPTIESLQARIAELEAQNATTESARVKAMEAQSRVSSELSKTKKELDARRTEEERKEAERQEAIQQMEARLKEYEHRELVSTYMTSYMSMKYTAEEAEKAATALADGDMTTLFEVQRAHQANMEQTIAQNALANTPTPPSGNAPKPLEEMTDAEYYAYIRSK